MTITNTTLGIWMCGDSILIIENVKYSFGWAEWGLLTKAKIWILKCFKQGDSSVPHKI